MTKTCSPLLNETEKQVLQLLSQGLTEKETALRMNKSVYTIDKYLRSIFEKFGIHTTAAVIAEAIRRKEIE